MCGLVICDVHVNVTGVLMHLLACACSACKTNLCEQEHILLKVSDELDTKSTALDLDCACRHNALCVCWLLSVHTSTSHTYSHIQTHKLTQNKHTCSLWEQLRTGLGTSQTRSDCWTQMTIRLAGKVLREGCVVYTQKHEMDVRASL
jgi:hypothetical protein